MRFPKVAVSAFDLPAVGNGRDGWLRALRAPEPGYRPLGEWAAETREVKFSPHLQTRGAPRWHFLNYQLAEGRTFLWGEGRDVLWSRHARAIAAPGRGLIEQFNVGGGGGIPDSLFAMDYRLETQDCLAADRAVTRVEGLTVPFSHFGGETFGHAVLDGLLQVWLWREALGSGEARLGVWKLPGWLEPVLERCGVRRCFELRGDVVLLRRAGLSSALAAQGVYFPAEYSKSFFDWLKNLYGLATPPVGPRRIYVRRSPTYARAVGNAAALEDLAIDHGFTPVAPELLSFENQVRLFAGADTVLSPWGSGLTLAPLLHGARRVVELVPSSVTDVWFVRQAMVHGLDYTPLLQASEPDGTFEADLVRIDKALRQVLADDAAA